MSGILSGLGSSADAMGAFQRALNVIQNNVSNQRTGGFAKQTVNLSALLFNPDANIAGGVQALTPLNSRTSYLESAVQQKQSDFGYSDQLAANLAQIESYFNATGSSGIPKSLSDLFQSFAALAVTPNDTALRGQVIAKAGDLSRNFFQASQGLADQSSKVYQQSLSDVQQVNQLVATLRDLNEQFQKRADSLKDTSLDAQLHATLEKLSAYGNFAVLRENDGTVTVTAPGSTQLLIGTTQYPVSAILQNGQLDIVDFQGQSIAPQITGGKLGAELDISNNRIPQLLASLNQLAQGVADTVNGVLVAGVDQNNVVGQPLFVYNLPSDAASTLKVTNISPDQIAAAVPSAPGGNGNALQVAALAQALTLGNQSFSDFYNALATSVGNQAAVANEDKATQQALLNQAQATRSDKQGVSLDEEAANLVEFQRAYQAAAQLFTVLNSLTDTTINLIK